QLDGDCNLDVVGHARLRSSCGSKKGSSTYIRARTCKVEAMTFVKVIWSRTVVACDQAQARRPVTTARQTGRTAGASRLHDPSLGWITASIRGRLAAPLRLESRRGQTTTSGRAIRPNSASCPSRYVGDTCRARLRPGFLLQALTG